MGKQVSGIRRGYLKTCSFNGNGKYIVRLGYDNWAWNGYKTFRKYGKQERHTNVLLKDTQGKVQ
jgi:hypothetical protein